MYQYMIDHLVNSCLWILLNAIRVQIAVTGPKKAQEKETVAVFIYG